MGVQRTDRRRFLKNGAALAGLAVGAIRSASAQMADAAPPTPPPKETHTYGERSRFETTARLRDRPNSNLSKTPLQDSIGIITASALHAVRTHESAAPDIDPRQHRLLIHGMVERPLIFTMEELKRLPSVSRILSVTCAGNPYVNPVDRQHQQTVEQTHGKTSCSEWTGVLLSVLLQEAGAQKGASWLLAEGSEPRKHSVSIPMAKAMDDIIVAYGQNGEAIRPEQGYPIRLVVPGWEGVRSVKWLRRIKVVERPYMAKLESVRYTNLRIDGKSRWFQFELEPNSVITRPSGGQTLTSKGFYEITGLAWAGGGAIRRVEISTDGGQTWKDAQLQEPILRMAHTRFRFPWRWDGQEAVLMSRCTDEWGDVQPTLAELSKIWNVNIEYWRSSTSIVQHFNACQPWKINRDGSIHNAMFT